MRATTNPALACLLLVATTSCAWWGRQNVETPSTSIEETHMHGLSPALATLERVEPPRLQWSDALLGAAVLDSMGRPAGTIQDVLLDPATGYVIGVAAELERADGSKCDVVLEYRHVAWSEDHSPELVLGCELSDPATNYPALFVQQELATLTGTVTEIEESDNRSSSALILKVHDSANLFHRVLVEPALLVRRSYEPLVLGCALQAIGVLTRDSSGKLLVASALDVNGERLNLRTAGGELLSAELAKPWPSARSLPSQPVVTADGLPVTISGWLLDWAEGVAAYACIEVDGSVRALPWADIHCADPTRAWTVVHNWAALRDLPTVSSERCIPSHL